MVLNRTRALVKTYGSLAPGLTSRVTYFVTCPYNANGSQPVGAAPMMPKKDQQMYGATGNLGGHHVVVEDYMYRG